MIIKYIFKYIFKYVYLIIIYMDKTIPTDDCGFPICDVEGLSGLYLYPQGYTSYDNNTSDKEQDEYNDEHINFDKLKNDELEEIFKRKQESKTAQDFKCNNCFNMWKCAWCYHGFCDDIMSPYKLEGKPQFWSINDVDPEWWKSKTEKEKRKIIKKCSEEPPILQNFFLCKWCKNEYIDKNISKGRHPKKFGRRLNTKTDWFW